MQIVDDFLDKRYFNDLVKDVFDVDFPWYYHEGINNYHDSPSSQYTHMLYARNQVKSRMFEHFEPILEQLNVFALLRMKLNCVPRTENRVEHEFHTDLPATKNDYTTAILYLNDNDGDTLFKDEKVRSVANRLVIFNGHTPHASTSNTDDAYRRVCLNINYIENMSK